MIRQAIIRERAGATVSGVAGKPKQAAGHQQPTLCSRERGAPDLPLPASHTPPNPTPGFRIKSGTTERILQSKTFDLNSEFDNLP